MDMKSLEGCNIAVCLVGQSRTFRNCKDSINSFFSTRNKKNNFFFFGHTWDTNTYKVKEDNTIKIVEERIEDIDKLRDEMSESFNFSDLIVEHNSHNKYPWGSVFYSTMMANFLKQKYEAENNMMFDFVVKARYDVCYKEGTHLEDYITLFEEKCLYSYFGLMRGEFFLPNPDDVIYGGTSLTMDLIDSMYNILSNDVKFNRLFSYNDNNMAYRKSGPGVLIHKWMTMKNILPRHIEIPRAVRRLQSDKITDWNELNKFSGFVF